MTPLPLHSITTISLLFCNNENIKKKNFFLFLFNIYNIFEIIVKFLNYNLFVARNLWFAAIEFVRDHNK